MIDKISVTSEAFLGMQNVDVAKLSLLSEQDLRPILPSLVRMSLCAPLDVSASWSNKRKIILKCLSGVEVVNNIVGLLSIDFHDLEQDYKREQQICDKINHHQQQQQQSESLYISQLENGLALEFERCDAVKKLRLVTSEFLSIRADMMNSASKEKDAGALFYEKSSELFDSEVHIDEVSDILCIVQAELHHLIPMKDIAETLLHVKHGAWLVCRLVANVPDSFLEVCSSLISNCSGNNGKQDDDSIECRRRTEMLLMLCRMCPSYALLIRSFCIEYCQNPSLAISLTLNYSNNSSNESKKNKVSELVVFVSGLLLDNDVRIRNWFSQFIRSSQKKKDTKSALFAMRSFLLEELNDNILKASAFKLDEDQVVRGCALIRLYSALKCIAGLKFSEEENNLLLQLITSKAPLSKTGIRFISLGFSMLLACLHFISNDEQEKQATRWIEWLVEEGDSYEQSSGIKSSFSELLLLIAIHFHSNQTNSIIELISTTLGMKTNIKASSLAKMKVIITQEIFTEQVVAAHAIKILVTPKLNADIDGFLPIHCIYQLLKSRAFSKNQIPIKDWIYQQLCQCTLPIHNIVPALIDTFINSTISIGGPAAKVNESIRNEEITKVFNPFLPPSHHHHRQETNNNDATAVDNKIEFDSHLIYSKDRNCLTADDDEDSFARQVLFLYYLLSYENALMKNMPFLKSMNRKVQPYSKNELIKNLPVKYLLQKAKRESSRLAGIYSSLLNLVATHYSHLCLVADWLDGENDLDIEFCEMLNVSSDINNDEKNFNFMNINYSNINDVTTMLSCNDNNNSLSFFRQCNPILLSKALETSHLNSSLCLFLLEQLSTLAPTDLLPYSRVIVENLPRFLLPNMPRRCQDLVFNLWSKLNALDPRLKVSTVNVLRCNNNNNCRKVGKGEDRAIVYDQKMNLRSTESISFYTEDEIISDPLIVLRCDPKVFRCPPFTEIILRTLDTFLQMSKSFLSTHILMNPVSSDKANNNNITNGTNSFAPAANTDREELRATLVAAQESAAIQILLECCMPTLEEEEIGTTINNNNNTEISNFKKTNLPSSFNTEIKSFKTENDSVDSNSSSMANKIKDDYFSLSREDKIKNSSPLSLANINRTDNLLSNRREIHGIVCSHIHQRFISDPSLAKLIHFQGYPPQLIPVTVSGISSMHICLDFIPELIAQPHRNKLIFSVELVSHLCLFYALPKSLSISKLCLNVLYAMINVLPKGVRSRFFRSVLPSLVRICTAFPVLADATVGFLIRLGKIINSELSVMPFSRAENESSEVVRAENDDLGVGGGRGGHSVFDTSVGGSSDSRMVGEYSSGNICSDIDRTFRKIVGSTLLLKSHLKT